MKWESLIGVIVVGCGIPQVETRQELLKYYFDAEGKNGYEYAYTYPGMNKVLQAAGRVIRTEDDRGVIVLLDERFLTTVYRNLFPKEWEFYKVVRLESVKEEILDFW